MKNMHKRLYTALPRPLATQSTPTPRVRSNSASSSSSTTSNTSTTSSRAIHTSSFGFFDSPPPTTTSRSNGLVVASRVKPEVESHSHNTPYGQHSNHNHPQSHNNSSGGPPYPLAFTSSQSDSSSSPFSNNSNNIFSPYPSFGPVATLDASPNGVVDSTQPLSCEKTRYHLDVGAYGIPKHSREVRVAGCDGRSALPSASTSQAPLQARCSAVQVGEDAYFVRDNAMGVADGVGGWAKCSRSSHDATPSALFAQRLMHYCSEEVEAVNETLEEELQDQLEDTLEDLSDGLDVLMILERAYDKTMRAHVKAPGDLAAMNSNTHSCRVSSTTRHHESLSPAATTTRPAPLATAAPSNPSVPDLTPSPIPIPLREGSATALLAILDHASTTPPATRPPTRGFGPSFFSPTPRKVSTPRTDAVIRIAHLGDCMGMLIRGEDIVWRTEEMWWNFNTPVQLGPQSSTRPQDARVFTVPVQADDILVLATDGLSDNLWDEDILDEVVRFRRSFAFSSPYSFPSLASLASTGPSSKASEGILGRRTFAGMLSEALCSRARSVSERRGSKKSGLAEPLAVEEDEIPFARRAREQGRSFRGGKMDDISVLIAVVSPVESASTPTPAQS